MTELPEDIEVYRYRCTSCLNTAGSPDIAHDKDCAVGARLRYEKLIALVHKAIGDAIPRCVTMWEGWPGTIPLAEKVIAELERAKSLKD